MTLENYYAIIIVDLLFVGSKFHLYILTEKTPTILCGVFYL